MAKNKLIPDFSESARSEMEKQMLAETGIDFSQYRTEELGTQIGDIMGVFSWVALILKVVVLVLPAVVLYFRFVITPPLTPVDSMGDVLLLILGVLWSLASLVSLGISTMLWFSMKKLSGTTSELLSLMLELLEKSAGVVKECTPELLVRLITTNSALVFFPLISSAIVAHLAIGKLRIPGTKFLAEKVGSVLAIKLSVTIIDKLGFSAEAEKTRLEYEAKLREKKNDEAVQEEGVPVKKKQILVDTLSLVQKASSTINDVNKRLRTSVVKPFRIIAIVCMGIAFLPPLILWL